MQKKKSSRWTTVILIVILIIGLSLLLYPTFSNWWNSRTQSKAVALYTEQIAKISNEEYDEYYCMMDLDEDEVYRITTSRSAHCPYYRQGDDYTLARRQ